MSDEYPMRFGGEIETMEHLPLRFPSKTERRKVKVYSHSYIGLAIDAIHWYADISEEDNCYVDDENETMLSPWGVWEHDHLIGRRDLTPFLSKIAAEQYVCEVLKEHYSPDTHYVYVDHDDKGTIYEELGFLVDTMYLDEGESMRQAVRRGLAARYKMGDI